MPTGSARPPRSRGPDSGPPRSAFRGDLPRADGGEQARDQRGYIRRRRPRGVGWNPASRSACASGDWKTPAPSARSTVRRPSAPSRTARASAQAAGPSTPGSSLHDSRVLPRRGVGPGYQRTGRNRTCPGRAGTCQLRRSACRRPQVRRQRPRALRYIIDHLPPGALIRRRILVADKSRSVAHVTVYPDAATIRHGLSLVTSAAPAAKLTTWIRTSRQALTLAPHASAMETVTIRVPRDASSGERYVVIWAQESANVRSGGRIASERLTASASGSTSRWALGGRRRRTSPLVT